jgi:hypothetical protein
MIRKYYSADTLIGIMGLISSLTTAIVFLVIEANDLLDYPAALAGLLLYILLSPT